MKTKNMENINVLEIGFYEDMDNYPDVTYTLNGVLLSTVHCLHDNQSELIKDICKALKCTVTKVVTRENGNIERWIITN